MGRLRRQSRTRWSAFFPVPPVPPPLRGEPVPRPAKGLRAGFFGPDKAGWLLYPLRRPRSGL